MWHNLVYNGLAYLVVVCVCVSLCIWTWGIDWNNFRQASLGCWYAGGAVASCVHTIYCRMSASWCELLGLKPCGVMFACCPPLDAWTDFEFPRKQGPGFQLVTCWHIYFGFCIATCITDKTLVDLPCQVQETVISTWEEELPNSCAETLQWISGLIERFDMHCMLLHVHYAIWIVCPMYFFCVEEAAVLAKWLKGVTLALAHASGSEHDEFLCYRCWVNVT